MMAQWVYALFLVVASSTGDSPQVQPCRKVKFTDSYLAVAVQVLTHVEDSLNKTSLLSGSRPIFVSELSGDDVRDECDYKEEFQELDEELVEDQILLVRLRDLLSAEARLKGLAGYQGLSDSVLSEIVHSSNSTAKEQVDTLIKTMLLRKHINFKRSKALSCYLIQNMSKEDSNLSKLLSSISPLKYT
ncbi:uncharacterized protein [Rhodnius prolixus]|uniref:uncharacterized protein n=1 Tax=Rhodnius prolixus TaxID=13249 RepID=UPI003D18859E